MNSSEFIKKARNQVIILVAFTVALVGMFLPGISVGSNFLGSSFSVSTSMFGAMGLWGLLALVGTVLTLGAVGFDAYNVYSGKDNAKRAMMAMIIAAGSPVVALVCSAIWYLTGSSAGSGFGSAITVSIGFGLILQVIGYAVAAFFSVTSVMKNKDYAKKVLNEVKGDITKGGEAK